MLQFILLVLTLCLSQTSVAQTTPSYRPITTSPFKSTLTVSQEVTLGGVSSSHAKLGPLMTSASGLGADRLTTPAYGYDLTALPRIPLPNPVGQEAALKAATSWVELNGRAQVHIMADYMKSNQITSGFFTFHQEFMMKTKEEPKRKAITWMASMDADGRPLYGNPKISDPDPTYIHATYFPKRVVTGFPPAWAGMYASAGKISYQLLNKRFEPIGQVYEIMTNGEYDEDMGGSGKVACLVDKRHSGSCSGPTDMRTLMDRHGSSGFFLDYVRQLEPVYRPLGDGESLVPEGAISYDKRILYCDKLVNEGFFGYVMHLQAQRYVGTPHPELTPFEATQQFNSRTISPTDPFRKELPYTAIPPDKADRYVISPHPGDNTLWDRNQANGTQKGHFSNVVYIAEMRSDEEGSGLLNVIKSPSDMVIREMSHVGSVREYYFGTIGDNYWHTGRFVRELLFDVPNKDHTPEMAVVEEGFDDWMKVDVNNRHMYSGSRGGNMLDYGRDSGTAVENCTRSGSGYRCTVESGTKAVDEEGKCPEGWKRLGFGPSASCQKTSERTFSWCLDGVCGNNCPPPLVQYSTSVSLSGTNRWNGCGNQELSTSWLFRHYIDLRSVLKNGRNSLVFTVIAKGGGEGWVKIRTRSCGVAEYALEAPPPPVPDYAGQVGVTNQNVDSANRIDLPETYRR